MATKASRTKDVVEDFTHSTKKTSSKTPSTSHEDPPPIEEPPTSTVEEKPITTPHEEDKPAITTPEHKGEEDSDEEKAPKEKVEEEKVEVEDTTTLSSSKPPLGKFIHPKKATFSSHRSKHLIDSSEYERDEEEEKALAEAKKKKDEAKEVRHLFKKKVRLTPPAEALKIEKKTYNPKAPFTIHRNKGKETIITPEKTPEFILPDDYKPPLKPSSTSPFAPLKHSETRCPKTTPPIPSISFLHLHTLQTIFERICSPLVKVNEKNKSLENLMTIMIEIVKFNQHLHDRTIENEVSIQLLNLIHGEYEKRFTIVYDLYSKMAEIVNKQNAYMKEIVEKVKPPMDTPLPPDATSIPYEPISIDDLKSSIRKDYTQIKAFYDAVKRLSLTTPEEAVDLNALFVPIKEEKPDTP
jgi:hypothetical protein